MRRILLCSNSIPLAGLAASLRGQPGLEVIHTDLGDLGEQSDLGDVVIVDADQAMDALALLRPRPAWCLVSVDAATGTLTTYAAQSQPVQEMEEIVQLIQSKVNLAHDSPDPHPGDLVVSCMVSLSNHEPNGAP